MIWEQVMISQQRYKKDYVRTYNYIKEKQKILKMEMMKMKGKK